MHSSLPIDAVSPSVSTLTALRSGSDLRPVGSFSSVFGPFLAPFSMSLARSSLLAGWPAEVPAWVEEEHIEGGGAGGDGHCEEDGVCVV